MRPLERNLLRFSACATALFVLAAIFMPVIGCGCSKIAAPRTLCLSNVKQQAMGLLMYAADHADRFPARDVWKDGIAPYVKLESVLREAKAAQGVYGYAFNAALSGAREDDPKVPMTYDSVNPIRNASDPLTSLPALGKHGGKNNVAYADGHAKTRPGGAW